MTRLQEQDIRFTSPILTPPQVAALVGMPEPTVRSWTRDLRTRPRMVHGTTPRRRGWPSVPLIGLAEAAALRALRQTGMTMRTAVNAAEFIREHIGDEFAMANPNLMTDGVEAFLHDTRTDEVIRIRDRQHAFAEVLRDHMRPLIIGPDGYVEAFSSLDRLGLDVTIDPRFSAGRMSFVRNRVPVFAVLDALVDGETPVSIAQQFQLLPSEVDEVDRQREWLALVA